MFKKKNRSQYYKTSLIEESIRSIRSNISFTTMGKSCRSILLTSSDANEGKSTIAVHLARSFAANSKKVLLIDCDLRNPSVGKIVGFSRTKGLTNLLLRNLELEDLIIKDPIEDNLNLLPAGVSPPNPAEILSSPKMKDFLKHAVVSYDLVLLDSPPVGILTDAAILSTMVDGVIVVVAEGFAHKSALKQAVNNLELVNARILGFVMNKVHEKRRSYGYYDSAY